MRREESYFSDFVFPHFTNIKSRGNESFPVDGRGKVSDFCIKPQRNLALCVHSQKVYEKSVSQVKAKVLVMIKIRDGRGKTVLLRSLAHIFIHKKCFASEEQSLV